MIPLLLAMSALGAEPVRLDFGPEDGAVLDGFVEVTPYRSAHPAARWTVTPGKARSLAWLDALADDHVTGGTLHLDLPPGTYAVAAIFQEHGYAYNVPPQIRNGLHDGSAWLLDAGGLEADAWFETVPATGVRRPRFEPENTPWERQIGPSTSWRIDTLEVPEQGVDLEIRGRELAALIVQPGGDTAALEVELALVDGARRRAWLETHGVWSGPLAWATEGLSQLERVPLDAWPTPGGGAPAASVEVALAPGERRVVQLAVHGSDAPATVSVEELPGVQVALHEVDWLDVDVSKRITRPTPHVLRPLDPQGQLRGGQGLVPMMAVELRVPDDAPPGLHRGRLRVTRDADSVQLDLQVRVRELELARAPVPWGFWSDLRGPVAELYGPDSEPARQRWRSEVALMRRWGTEHVSIRGTFRPARRPMPESADSMYGRIRWATDTWRRFDPETGGFVDTPSSTPGDVQWHDVKFLTQNRASADPDLPVFTQELEAFIRDMFAVAAELDVYTYTSDEEVLHYGPSRVAQVARRLDRVRELAGEVGLTASSPHPAGWTPSAPRVDRVYTNGTPQMDPSHARVLGGQRAEAWGYNYGWQREATGSLPWRTQPEGLLIWHLNDKTGASYNDLARRRGYAVVLRGASPGSAIPTRRLVRLGHGGFDQRYYGTLAALVEELGDRRRRRIRDAVDHACTLLYTASTGIDGRRFDLFDAAPMRDSAALQALQDEVGDTAEVLARWSREQRAVRSGERQPDRGGFLPERCRLRSPPVSPYQDPHEVPPLSEVR